jgi:hypothetical protein
MAKHNKTVKHVFHSSPSPKDILSELEIIKLELVELKKQSTKPTEDPVVYCCGCGETFKESEKPNHKCKQTAKPICKLNL